MGGSRKKISTSLNEENCKRMGKTPSRNEVPAARLGVIERSTGQVLFNNRRVAGGQVRPAGRPYVFSEPAAYSLSLMKLIKTICIYYRWGLRKLFFNLLWSCEFGKCRENRGIPKLALIHFQL